MNSENEPKYVFQIVRQENGVRSAPINATMTQLRDKLDATIAENNDVVLPNCLLLCLGRIDDGQLEVVTFPLMKVSSFLLSEVHV